jgi:hypothetical protein
LSEKVRESLPVEPLALAATAQPLVPGPLRRLDEPQQTPKVAADAAVIEMTSQAYTERGVLLLDRRVPMATAPVVDGRLCPSEARPPRLAPHLPVTCTGTHPITREPHTVKGGRTFPTLLCLWWTPKGPPPRFVRVQGPSEAPSPFAEYREHTPCITLTLKADDAVVTVTHQGCFPLKPWLPLGGKPPVEPIVPIDVPQ